MSSGASAAGHWDPAQLRHGARIRRMVRVNGDIFLRSIGVQVALTVFTATGARMGDVELAANAILLNLSFFMTYGLDGFANAAEALTGEAFGARNRARFRAAVAATTRWAVVTAVFFAAVYAVLGPWALDLMTGVPAVRAMAGDYLGWVIGLPLVAVWCYHLDGIFIGATWTRQMRDGMAVSTLVYVLSVFLAVPVFGNHGLWFSFHVFMAMRALTLGVRYPGLERRMEAS